jgi:hypothetical protein
MFVVLRLVSLILIVAALMLLGADLITTLETRHFTVRSVTVVWGLLDKGGPDAFLGWANRTLPGMLAGWLKTVLSLYSWAVLGVVGIVLAFLFGRRAGP